MKAAAAALLLFAAAPAGAEEAVLPAEAPAAPPPVLARWRIRPYLGLSTVRLGGVDAFPLSAVRHGEPLWLNSYGVTVTDRERRLINFAFVEGLEGAVQLDPIISVAARVGRLVAQEGRVRTTARGSANTLTDEWHMAAELLTIGGGALFHLPLRPATRLNVTLFLGGGLASVRLDHRQSRTGPGGYPLVNEGGTTGTGTTFIPEFTLEFEHDVTDSVTAGVGGTVRFGGIQSFASRFDSTLNDLNGVADIGAGGPIRDQDGSLLTADYGGVVLSVYLVTRL